MIIKTSYVCIYCAILFYFNYSLKTIFIYDETIKLICEKKNRNRKFDVSVNDNGEYCRL